MEYVRISSPEKKYGNKNLLRAQLALINSNKRILAYKELRSKEMLLRIELKLKITEALNLIKTLDKILPHIKIHSEEKIQEKIKEEETKQENLEEELQRIKRKLSALQERF